MPRVELDEAALTDLDGIFVHNPSSIPSRAESSRRRSSIGQSQCDSSSPADALDPATLPRWAAFRYDGEPANGDLLVCLLSTELIDAPLFRLSIAPSPATGLHQPSQIMVDKLLAVPRDRIRERVGAIGHETLLALNRALALMLGFAGV